MDSLFFDHVNLVLEHQEPNYPGVPPHYVPEINWNFSGTEKRKRNKKDINIKLCPHLDFMYCDKPHCQSCQHNPDKSVKDARQSMIVIPANLVETQKPISLDARPPEERREIQDKIGDAIIDYKTTMNPGAIGELLRLAEMLGYSPMWVYWRLTSDSRHTKNIPVLHEIARQKKYKPGWVYITLQKLKYQKRRNDNKNRMV